MMIFNDEEHAAALKQVEALMGAQPGTPDGDELNSLVDAIQEYEGRTRGTFACPHCGHEYIHTHSAEELAGPKCATCGHLISLHGLGALGWTRIAGWCGFGGTRCGCDGDNRAASPPEGK